VCVLLDYVTQLYHNARYKNNSTQYLLTYVPAQQTSIGVQLVALFKDEIFFFECLLPFIINHNLNKNYNIS
jgi:hypothetical protein